MQTVFADGIVATEPRFYENEDNPDRNRLMFRLAINERRRDDGDDRESTFMTVTCFGRLADHCNETLTKRMRVLVNGKLNVYSKEYEELDHPIDQVSINAYHVGIDLNTQTADVTYHKRETADGEDTGEKKPARSTSKASSRGSRTRKTSTARAKAKAKAGASARKSEPVDAFDDDEF